MGSPGHAPDDVVLGRALEGSPMPSTARLTMTLKKSDEKDVVGLGVRKWTVANKVYIYELKAGGLAARWNQAPHPTPF